MVLSPDLALLTAILGINPTTKLFWSEQPSAFWILTESVCVIKHHSFCEAYKEILHKRANSIAISILDDVHGINRASQGCIAIPNALVHQLLVVLPIAIRITISQGGRYRPYRDLRVANSLGYLFDRCHVAGNDIHPRHPLLTALPPISINHPIQRKTLNPISLLGNYIGIAVALIQEQRLE